MKQKKFKPFLYCLLTAIMFAALRIYDPYPVEILRLKGLDYYQKKQNTNKSELFTIIEIDEASLEKFGQYPFKGDVFAY